MDNASDVNDRSGNGFHATATAVDTGADGPPVFSSPNVPPGITVVPPAEVQIVNNAPVWKYMTVTQHVIPRYAWGVLQPAISTGTRSIAPAGELRGWGPMSVIRGNSSTEMLSDLIDYRAVVITEDIDRITAMFGSGEYQQNLKPAVLRPVIRDVSIWGHDDTSTNYTDNGKVSNQPAVDNPIGSWPDLYHGARVKGTGIIVDNVQFFYIPGTAFHCSRTGGTPAGKYDPWDVEKNRITNCTVHRAYRGFEIQVVDAVVGNLQGYALRDYGIKFVAGAGATQIDSSIGALHFWGVGTGGTAPAPAVWFESGAGPCWGGPIYAENSPVGIQMGSSGNKITGFYSKDCTLRNLWITGERNSVTNFEIEVKDGVTEGNGGEGVLITNQSNSLSTGSFGGLAPVPAGEIAIRLTNGTRQVIRDVDIVGTSGSSKPLISVEHQLNNSIVVAKCVNAGIFLDLYTNSIDRLGIGNHIWLGTAGTVTEAVNLPSTWNKSNRITVDGLRLRGSITGVTDAAQAEITSTAHGLTNGDKIAIDGVRGDETVNSSPGTVHTVTVTGVNTFTIPVNTSGSPMYTAGTGWWGEWETK